MKTIQDLIKKCLSNEHQILKELVLELLERERNERKMTS